MREFKVFKDISDISDISDKIYLTAFNPCEFMMYALC
jgi:hypothetical protein